MVDMNERPKPRLWLRGVLIVSLGLNLLVLGLVGGAMLRFGPEGMRLPPRSVGAALYRELPRKDRRALWAGSKQTHRDRHARQKAEALALGVAIRATPFDAATLEAVLDQQAARRGDLRKSMQAAWLARVAGMSPDERQAFADRLAPP